MNGTRSKNKGLPNTSPKRKATEIEVIEITDSSDEEPHHKQSRTTRSSKSTPRPSNGKARAKSKNLVRKGSSIVLLDEPPEGTSSSSAVVKDLQEQLENAKKRIQEDEKLQQEIDSLRKANDDLRLEYEMLRQETAQRQSMSEGKSTATVDINELDELTTCEICANRMWQPALLPDCGHVFCQGCLQDWFSQTLARHVHDNPHYYDQQPLHPTVLQFLASPHLLRHPHVRQLVEQVMTLMPKSPVYTCPSCRDICKSGPSEVYLFKKVVLLAAKAIGEEEPLRNPHHKGKARAKGDAFSGFFPGRA